MAILAEVYGLLLEEGRSFIQGKPHATVSAAPQPQPQVVEKPLGGIKSKPKRRTKKEEEQYDKHAESLVLEEDRILRGLNSDQRDKEHEQYEKEIRRNFVVVPSRSAPVVSDRSTPAASNTFVGASKPPTYVQAESKALRKERIKRQNNEILEALIRDKWL